MVCTAEWLGEDPWAQEGRHQSEGAPTPSLRPQLLSRAPGWSCKTWVWPRTKLPQRDAGCNCCSCSCQRQENQAGKGRRSRWPFQTPDPAFRCWQGGHHPGTAGNPRRQSPWIHVLVSTAGNLQLAILEEFRGLCLQAGQDCWRKWAPSTPAHLHWA